MASRIIRGIAILYGVLGAIALLLVPASVFGWLGVPPDPLSGVYAYLLSLPWILVLLPFEETGTWVALAVAAMGIAINIWLLWRIARLFRR